jgi:hypothetical protein
MFHIRFHRFSNIELVRGQALVKSCLSVCTESDRRAQILAGPSTLPLVGLSPHHSNASRTSRNAPWRANCGRTGHAGPNQQGEIMSTPLHPPATRLSVRTTWVLACLLSSDVGWSQEFTSPSATEAVTAESIQRQIEHLDATEDLDDATDVEVRDLLQQALRESVAIKKWAAETEEYRRSAAGAISDAATVRHELQKFQSAKVPSISPAATIAELKERLTLCESEVPVLRAAAAAAEEEPNRRNLRRVMIAELLAELRDEEETVKLQLGATPPLGENAGLTAARGQYLAMHQRAIREQIAALES